MIAILSNPSYFLPPLIGVVIIFALIIMALLWSRRDFSTLVFCGFLGSIVSFNLVIFGMRASPDIHHALLWEKALGVPSLAIFVLYYHFTLIYTSTRGQRRILLAAYLLLVLVAIISPTDLLVKEMTVETYGYAPVIGPASYFLFATGPLLLFAGARNLLKTYRVSPWREERKRLVLLMIGIMFPLIGLIIDSYTDLPPATIWGNLILATLCTIAILRYNLLEIRVVVRKSLVYLLISVVVAIPYVGVLFLASEVFEPEIEAWWIYAVMILFLAIILRPLYGWAQNLVDRLFFRDRYDYLRALEQFSHETRSIADPEELGSTLVRLVGGALKSSSTSLLLLSEAKNGFAVVCCVGLDNPMSGTVIKRGSPLAKWLKLNGRILSSRDFDVIPELQNLTRIERGNLAKLRAELYVPIKTRQGELPGILVLGQKLSQQSYSHEDNQLLMMLSNQMAVVIENARLYEKTRESEQKLRLMYESMAEGITVSDLDGNIVQANEAMLRMHGYDSKEELIGRSLFELIAKKDNAKAMGNLKRTLKDGYIKNSEYTFLKSDGGEFPAELSAAVLKDSSGNPAGFVVVTEDITERKQAEERERKLQQELNLSSRLAAIGELASGIAHEINNPLTGIMGFSQRLLRKSTDKTSKRDLERIYDEAQRTAKVVENLQTFGRRKEPKKECLDIDAILQKALDMRIYELKASNIEVVTELASALPTIMVDFHQIQQVFLNIILNAEQVMTEANGGGKLVIKTQEKKGYVSITFTDDGPGISDENLDRLFDPFFTSRGEKGGTGLGLSICHRIVTDHGGRIYAKSKPGKGATFFVELPIMRETADKNKIA